VTSDTVLIVDFKTNRAVPASLDAAPAGYLAQLAVYRRLLAEIYPNHKIRAAILWTNGPSLMEIPSDRLDAMAIGGITAS